MNKKTRPWLRFIEGPDGSAASTATGAQAAAASPNEVAETKGGPADEVDYKAKYEAMKAHSREWEQKAKANLAAAKKLQEIEDAGKTELEKLTSKLEAEQAANAAKDEQLLRFRIAAKHGLTAEDAELFLHGDEAAMTTQAEQLAKRASNRKLAEDPNQGRGTGTHTKAAAEAWAKSLFKK